FEVFFLLLVTYFAYQLLIKFAKKVSLIDLPNSRSSHVLPTIKGFGVVLCIAIGITLFVFNQALFIKHSNLLSAVLLVGILGLVDDMVGTNPFIKIATLVIVYSFLYAEGFLITNLGVFLGVSLNLNLMLAILFTILAIVAFTNAFNLIDGLDGLSGLIAIIIFLSFLIIGIKNNDQFLITIPILFVTSLVVFLFYNWYPAKVFLGDSGSLMIGFTISLMAIRSLNYIEPISILYITAVPIIDFLFVTTRRLLDGVSIFKADRLHCHHILQSYFNNSVRKTVIVIAVFQTLFSSLGLVFVSEVNDSFIVLALFILIFFIIFKLLNNIRATELN
ncbi:undecaprenyl/decaprenyl-phosphate alpha-N-acetylglucosaminyl 1-phosphate transferase, partial [Candidatus Thioglobus sp.]|nr:undecaprenyl/decaprenyl-phosphate alpha-N-acetylglucosaminyl 1-phosphate transferase [Candidatus Thioglobus sp.]